jgi:preprotein translocase subunit SecA
LRDTLCEQLGEETCAQLQTQPLQSLDREQVIRVMDEFGRRMLTEVYRQLLLGVITELWVDYLTQMEALRVSIGLEAYGQRDPLVEYKREAFDKFQNLLKDMRAGVISRMFIYRPRDMSAMQTEVRRPTPEEAGVGLQPTLEIAEATGDDGNEPAAGSPADGSEEQEQAEELEMEAQPDQPNLSRSQKRRRHRK